MDLGCLDPSVSVSDNQCTDLTAIDLESKKKENDSSERVTASSRSGKSKFVKENSQSTTHGLNKFTSHIKKPSHRKVSPLNWFPRKKVDPYLKRKIKMLQEVDGLNLTLDETLGDSNPHYSRVLKEKMATREAAHKAMEARKAALVETSWCRILRAARIQCKEAEDQLLRAEKTATEAFEAARAMGVIMYDTPNGPQKTYKMETSSTSGTGSTAHTITASFETEFDVDKEVAAAVKTALIRLANCCSFREDEFKELLRKISQNPDNLASSELSSECVSENGLERDTASQQVVLKIEELMYERLSRLREDELSSLATIVATCGLNAALAEVESGKRHDQSSVSALNLPRRMSSIHNERKQESGLPSLDKFLVKHMTKLEREVLEAKNSRKNELKEMTSEIPKVNLNGNTNLDISASHNFTHLGSLQEEKVVPNLKQQCSETKCEGREEINIVDSNKFQAKQCEETSTLPSLDKYLVKSVSRLEKEVQEAKNRRKNELHGRMTGLAQKRDSSASGESFLKNLNHVSAVEQEDKENVYTEGSLDKILVKPVHRLEREKMMALLTEDNYQNRRETKKQRDNSTADCKSLDEILVKRVSRLEKEKMSFCSMEKPEESALKTEKRLDSAKNADGGLDEILVKHKSRLEREKLVAYHESEKQNKNFISRREARERDLQAAWGGLGLGDSIKPHQSKLEREKAAWIKAEEDERKQVMNQV